MSHAYIPKSAIPIGMASVQTPDGIGSLTAWRGYASKGYRTKFNTVLSYWVSIVPAGGKAYERSMTPAKFEAFVHSWLTSAIPDDCTVIKETGCFARAECVPTDNGVKMQPKWKAGVS